MKSDKKTICVVTGTRAEYGLLKPLIFRILRDEDLCLRLVATGMHLVPEFGYTWCEIEEDGIPIDEKLEILMASDTNAGMVKSTAVAMMSFADYFSRKRPDMLAVLGDRYETFSAAVAAALNGIPIAHFYGGDTTEGAVDEFIRHAITKMAYLHFPSNEQAHRRIIQLGEQPSRIFNFGALGTENILNMELMGADELAAKFGFRAEGLYSIVTFHPVTMETEMQTKAGTVELLKALDRFPDMRVIITKANSDANGRAVNAMMEEYAAARPRCFLVDSLGLKGYLSTMKNAAMVIGNSSSGLYEAPCFHVPTVNIGDRQRGRLQPASVINCAPEESAIAAAMEKALTPQWKQRARETVNPFGDGHTSERAIAVIKKYLYEKLIDTKKVFYDIPGVKWGQDA